MAHTGSIYFLPPSHQDNGLISKTGQTLVELYKKKKKNQPHPKNGRKRRTETSSEKKYRWPKGIQKKICINSFQGYINQSNNEVSSHSSETGAYYREEKYLVGINMGGRDPHSPLVGLSSSSIFWENDIDTSENKNKTRNWVPIWAKNSISWHLPQVPSVQKLYSEEILAHLYTLQH